VFFTKTAARYSVNTQFSYSTVLYRYTFCVYISVLKCAHYSTDFGARMTIEFDSYRRHHSSVYKNYRQRNSAKWSSGV